MTSTTTGQPENPMIAFLESLRDKGDRGALASLRRGLGKQPGTVAELHPYIVRFLAPHRWTWREQTCYIIAPLFAWHPEPGGRGNFGSSFHDVWVQRDRGESIEQRFVALLNSHRDDLHQHLRQTVGLAKTSGVPINWRQLHRDIVFWDHESGRTRREWAQSFWGKG